MKVCKFGGSSMASGETIKKVADIIRSDEKRKYIVVSAPGKRFKEDIKITDSLLNAYAECKKGKKLSSLLQPIFDRFNGIAKDLGIEDKVDLAAVFEEIEVGVVASPIPDYAAAQGERLSALLLAEYLGYEFWMPVRSFVLRTTDNLTRNTQTTLRVSVCRTLRRAS